MSGWKTNNSKYGSHYSRSNTQSKKKIGKSTTEYLQSQDVGKFIHQQQRIAQRQRHGLFTQPLGLAPGNPYHDPEIYKPQKGMEVNKRMHQKVGPQTFSKPSSTNLGDPYKDPFRANQLYQKEKTDLSIHPHAFIAGGKQKLVKNSQYQHMKEFADKQYNTRDQNGRVKTGKKQITTNNMKKGFGSTTHGYLFSEYEYKGYPQEEGRQKDRNQKMNHKAKVPKPFKNSHPTRTFDPDYVIKQQKQDPFRQTKDDQLYRGKSTGNWKYNNPNKKGYNGTFTQFPQYIQQGQKQKKPIKSQNPWIHNYNGTSKGVSQTISRPCVPASQMFINQMRRTRG